MRLALTIPTATLIGSLSISVLATLPPPSHEAKAKAAETAAKSAWSDKVGLYKLCVSMDQTASRYRDSTKAAGKPVPAPVPTPPCADPGPYAAQGAQIPITPATSKPLEAAGAHSPPGAAISPPSTKATAAEIAGSVKK